MADIFDSNEIEFLVNWLIGILYIFSFAYI